MRTNIGCLTVNYHKLLLKFFIESAIVNFLPKRGLSSFLQSVVFQKIPRTNVPIKR